MIAATAIPVNKTAIGADDPIDLDASRAISLVDLLIGNPDRHEGNILVCRDPTGRWIPIPIDHNFALITEAITGVPSWTLAPIPVPGASAPDVAAYGERYLTFNQRNRVTSRAMRGPEGQAGLAALAARLRTRLTDNSIARMVRAVPPEAIVGRPAEERFAELAELLRTRRDALPAFLERYFAARTAN